MVMITNNNHEGKQCAILTAIGNRMAYRPPHGLSPATSFVVLLRADCRRPAMMGPPAVALIRGGLRGRYQPKPLDCFGCSYAVCGLVKARIRSLVGTVMPLSRRLAPGSCGMVMMDDAAVYIRGHDCRQSDYSLVAANLIHLFCPLRLYQPTH